MPHPSIKVAKKVSFFQSKPRLEDLNKEENADAEKMSNEKQSQPSFGGSEIANQKAVLKRTKSRMDRFASARKMWETRGSDSCLNTSNSSVTSTGSNMNPSPKPEKNMEDGFLSVRKMWESRGSERRNTSNSSITPLGSCFNTLASETKMESNVDEPKFRGFLIETHGGN